jgi:hypothetical protein
MPAHLHKRRQNYFFYLVCLGKFRGTTQLTLTFSYERESNENLENAKKKYVRPYCE